MNHQHHCPSLSYRSGSLWQILDYNVIQWCYRFFSHDRRSRRHGCIWCQKSLLYPEGCSIDYRKFYLCRDPVYLRWRPSENSPTSSARGRYAQLSWSGFLQCGSTWIYVFQRLLDQCRNFSVIEIPHGGFPFFGEDVLTDSVMAFHRTIINFGIWLVLGISCQFPWPQFPLVVPRRFPCGNSYLIVLVRPRCFGRRVMRGGHGDFEFSHWPSHIGVWKSRYNHLYCRRQCWWEISG